MSTFRRLVKLWGVAAAALALTAVALSAYSALDAARPDSLLSPTDAAVMTFAYSVIIGGVIVALVGVPIYYWLELRGWNKLPQAAALGAGPGLAVLSVDIHFATVSVICGLSVALLTHAWASKDPSH